jgi:hypothetical protein
MPEPLPHEPLLACRSGIPTHRRPLAATTGKREYLRLQYQVRIVSKLVGVAG